MTDRRGEARGRHRTDIRMHTQLFPRRRAHVHTSLIFTIVLAKNNEPFLVLNADVRTGAIQRLSEADDDENDNDN